MRKNGEYVKEYIKRQKTKDTGISYFFCCEDHKMVFVKYR